MYTILRETDGCVTFRTHIPVDELSPEEARRILSGLSPILEELGDLAGGEWLTHPPDISRRRKMPGRESSSGQGGGELSPPGSDPEFRVAGGERIAPGRMPVLGRFSLQQARRAADQEWRRRLGGSPSSQTHPEELVAGLVVFSLKPDSPIRKLGIEWHLEEARRRLKKGGRKGKQIARELFELSCALWHVLLTSGLSVEQAAVLRKAIDDVLLEGVDRSDVSFFSPGLGPLRARSTTAGNSV